MKEVKDLSVIKENLLRGKIYKITNTKSDDYKITSIYEFKKNKRLIKNKCYNTFWGLSMYLELNEAAFDIRAAYNSKKHKVDII